MVRMSLPTPQNIPCNLNGNRNSSDNQPNQQHPSPEAGLALMRDSGGGGGEEVGHKFT
jgi:hypothetical protein